MSHGRVKKFEVRKSAGTEFQLEYKTPLKGDRE
jgi:hypothetical protein